MIAAGVALSESAGAYFVGCLVAAVSAICLMRMSR
jgi:hypothetical protein